MIYSFTNFAADNSSSGLGALGVDGKDFLIQLATFVLAFLVLQRYAFQPILKVMRERQATIESGVKLGEEMKVERTKLEAEVEQKLQEARQKADSVITDAQDAARQTIREAEDKARTKAAGILQEAEARIAQDTTRARNQLEKELVGLISEVTEAVVEEKIDTAKDTQLIERALKERQAA
jgi:F-type H+-transporting ATPase subunit b